MSGIGVKTKVRKNCNFIRYDDRIIRELGDSKMFVNYLSKIVKGIIKATLFLEINFNSILSIGFHVFETYFGGNKFSMIGLFSVGVCICKKF